METRWTEGLKAQADTGVQEFLVVVMLAPPSGHKCSSVTVLNRPEMEASADEGLLIEQFQISGTLLHRQLGGEESLFSRIKLDVVQTSGQMTDQTTGFKNHNH